MSTRRQFKVTYVYEAGSIDPSGNVRGRDSGTTSSSHELAVVRRIARNVSRCGGKARVWTHDPTTGEEYTLRTYEPFDSELDDLMCGGV